ncbi:MAG: Na(+)-translocating NADH-quinone reductase subunit C [Thermoanaerobaculia bacterium]|nr:Na(+)-translocating NADH-quinone reductase subunit C [Thermoanaerobaculia bacterium]
MSQQRFSVRYIILFSMAVCGVCAVFVSSLAVSLADEQDANKLLDRRKNVLMAAGDVQPKDDVSAEQINELFGQYRAKVIDLATGEEVADIDPTTFDQRKAKKDPARSEPAPSNRSSIQRVPNNALIYEKLDTEGNVELVVLPIEGYGLWTTLYGFLALDRDTRTIRGLAYYEHGETPGLGGEVDNPRWRALWPGRLAFDDQWQVKIQVIKGTAGPVAEDPHRVDGLAGATITARGVTNMLDFWLGESGFEAYLQKLRNSFGTKGAA